MPDIENSFLLKEAAAQARREKIISYLKKYKKPIAAIIAVKLTLIFGISSYFLYQDGQEKKYSKILHNVLVNEDEESMMMEMEKLYQEKGLTKGVKALVSLRYAAVLAKKGSIEDAVKSYLQINKNNGYDKYITELAGLFAVKTLIDQNDKKYESKITKLLEDLDKKSKLLKYFIIEQKGIFEWQRQNFKEAASIFRDLSANPEASEFVQKRADEIYKIYVSRFGELQIANKQKVK